MKGPAIYSVGNLRPTEHVAVPINRVYRKGHVMFAAWVALRIAVRVRLVVTVLNL